MIIPLVFISQLINDSNGALSVVLSLVPFTAPVAMMTRLAAGPVPLWELGLAILFLVLTAMLVVRSVAGMFRAQNLLSGQAFNLRIFIQAMAGRL